MCMPRKAVKEKALPAEPVTTMVEPPSVRRTTVSDKKDRFVPFLVGAVIVAAFMVGFLYGKVTVYEKVGNGTQAGTQKAAQADSGDQAAAPTVSLDKIKALFADKNNIVFGDAKRKVLFAEFSDPSCPYCHIAAGKNTELLTGRFATKDSGGSYVPPVPEMKKLVDQGKAAYVWVYTSGHGNGELATQALYCAKDQNKFWEVHDLLMSKEGYTLLNDTVQNDTAKIPQLADFLKNAVKVADMQQCLQSGKYAGRIQADQALASQYGVQGTPNFFVNEKNYGGAYSFADMQSAVDAALK